MIKYYKSCLNYRLQLFTIADTVTHCNTNSGCLHEHDITMFHKNIVTYNNNYYKIIMYIHGLFSPNSKWRPICDVSVSSSILWSNKCMLSYFITFFVKCFCMYFLNAMSFFYIAIVLSL